MRRPGVVRRLAACAGIVGLLSSSALAQGTPALFLHGLQSAGSDWASTASRLQQRLAIDARTPDLPWRQPYEEQAQSLAQSDVVRSFTKDPIAVGHSNGGIVARELSRLRRVAGIATIGTPHRGAPILPRFAQWLTFQASAPSLLNEALSAFTSYSDWSWTFASVAGALSWVSDFSIWSVVYLGTSMGLGAALPVTGEMQPGSAYLNGLNSSSNLQREAANVPGRVGLVSVAHNFYFAGPARAIAPDRADEIAAALYATAFGLLYWGNYIFTESDPTDVVALRQSTSLLGIGGFLLSIDPFYCSVVSGTAFGDCVPNDGVVPYTSQEYPGAPNVYLGLDNDGPAHSQEKDWAEGVLGDALTWYLSVPPRTPAPPPTPTPTPPPPPTPPPAPAPAPTPPPAPAPAPPPAPAPDPSPAPPPTGPRDNDPGRLWPGDILYPDQGIRSADGQYFFVYQGDGNLVLYDAGWTPLWNSQTAGTAAGLVAMQGDGNFVMYDAGGTPIWASGVSFNHPGAFLALQTDGNVVIYDVDGRPLWATGTWQR